MYFALKIKILPVCLGPNLLSAQHKLLTKQVDNVLTRDNGHNLGTHIMHNKQLLES